MSSRCLYSSHNENITLKKEKKEESDAVYQYLDEIRNLSTQKEQLAKELENENKSLKAETAQIRMENEALLAQIQLVTKLTSNEGLHQQLMGKTITEQIEFFLEERSNYITRLEQLQNELQVANKSKSSLQQQLSKMQTSLEKVKEKNHAIVQKSTEAEQTIQDLKKSHEKEKTQKYFKIQAQMAETKQKSAKLQEEMKSLKENSAAIVKQHQIEIQDAKDEIQGSYMATYACIHIW